MDQKKYAKIRQQLIDSTQWPSIYMFKFIIPNKDEKTEAVKAMFPKGTKFSFKTSRDMRFLSITIKIKMKNADAVIAIYKKAEQIEDLFAL